MNALNVVIVSKMNAKAVHGAGSSYSWSPRNNGCLFLSSGAPFKLMAPSAEGAATNVANAVMPPHANRHKTKIASMTFIQNVKTAWNALKKTADTVFLVVLT